MKSLYNYFANNQNMGNDESKLRLAIEQNLDEEVIVYPNGDKYVGNKA